MKTKTDKLWFKKTGWIIFMLVFFFPVGLWLMWKYSSWKIITKLELSALFVVAVIAALFTDSSTSTSKSTNYPTNLSQVETSNVEAIETPKSALDKIKEIENNADVYITGQVLYIRKNLKHTKKAYYHSEAKEVYNEIHDLLDELPSEVNTICVWYDTEFIDKLGNESIDTAYRINMKVSTLESINWDNYIGLDFEALCDGDMYAFSGLK